MKKKKSFRPRMLVATDEMKGWSAALSAEVAGWPQTSTRSFFGLTGIYRKDKIFAALPRTRALGTPNSLAFKLETTTPSMSTGIEKDTRFAVTTMRAARWFTFELSSEADLRDALKWLGLAYEAAGKKRKSAN